MWLLNVPSLQLEHFSFSGPGCPPYAILSHTWEDEEVTFQDLQNGTGAHKSGCAKVTGTCQQAVKHGLSYAWIDTCCIDKSSSAELSEAINSMWKWYCDAAVCFIYLSDVATDCPDLADTDGDNADPFRFLSRCRWFRRGFTLQELLAPSIATFFRRDWNAIGHKKDLISTLSKITGIDCEVLRARDLIGFCSIATKLSWAAGRSTTREEDRSYSLLGIFGVNLPLLYGEGSKAFIRLQEELIRTSTDQSIFAWDASSPELLAPSPDSFRSRRKIITHLNSRFTAPYRLTNLGVDFDCMPLVAQYGRCFAILNCRYDDDYRGRIALQLESSSASQEASIEDSEKYFHVSPMQSSDLEAYLSHAKPHGSSLKFLSKQGRIGVLREDAIEIKLARRVTILTDVPNDQSALRRFWAGAQIWSIRIWFELESLPGLYIEQAYPVNDWNCETGVVVGTPEKILGGRRPRARIAGSVSVRSRAKGYEDLRCTVALEILRTISSDYCMSWHDECRILLSCKGSAEQARNRLDQLDLCSESWTADETLGAILRRREIHGEIVYKIELSTRKCERA